MPPTYLPHPRRLPANKVHQAVMSSFWSGKPPHRRFRQKKSPAIPGLYTVGLPCDQLPTGACQQKRHQHLTNITSFSSMRHSLEPVAAHALHGLASYTDLRPRSLLLHLLLPGDIIPRQAVLTPCAAARPLARTCDYRQLAGHPAAASQCSPPGPNGACHGSPEALPAAEAATGLSSGNTAEVGSGGTTGMGSVVAPQLSSRGSD
jgi:hypothetical protein